MIWTTVSFQSCFCWLYRASPSLSGKNIINLISVLTIWWTSMCRVMSCVVGRGCLLWPVRSFGKTLLAFARLHSVLQGQIFLYSRCFLTSYCVVHGVRKSWTELRDFHFQFIGLQPSFCNAGSYKGWCIAQERGECKHLVQAVVYGVKGDRLALWSRNLVTSSTDSLQLK